MSENKDYEFNERIHSILINPYLSIKDLDKNINLIKKYNIKHISTTLNFLSYLKDSVSRKEIKINTLISYPFGDLPNSFSKELILFAKDAGTDSIEYTPKFFLLAKNQVDNFAKDIENLSNLGLPITLIFNKRKLDKEIFIKAINIALELGIQNFQFGDGFSEHLDVYEISEIIKILGNNNCIKIVGGIKKIKDVKDILDTGAKFIGTSFFHNIFEDLKNN
tara:strand:- start:99 stop:761 length:663 start_codon:yes stop_codon:yes gene_type:complete